MADKPIITETSITWTCGQLVVTKLTTSEAGKVTSVKVTITHAPSRSVTWSGSFEEFVAYADTMKSLVELLKAG